MILNVVDQINNALIVDNRYKYILTGVSNTLIMAFFAVIIGLILGLAIALIRNNYDNNKRWRIFNILCKIILASKIL